MRSILILLALLFAACGEADDVSQVLARDEMPAGVDSSGIVGPDTSQEADSTLILRVTSPAAQVTSWYRAIVIDGYVTRMYFVRGTSVGFDDCFVGDSLRGECADEHGRPWVFEGLYTSDESGVSSDVDSVQADDG